MDKHPFKHFWVFHSRAHFLHSHCYFIRYSYSGHFAKAVPCGNPDTGLQRDQPRQDAGWKRLPSLKPVLKPLEWFVSYDHCIPVLNTLFLLPYDWDTAWHSTGKPFISFARPNAPSGSPVSSTVVLDICYVMKSGHTWKIKQSFNFFSTGFYNFFCHLPTVCIIIHYSKTRKINELKIFP